MLEVIIIGLAAFVGFTTQMILGFGTSLFLVPALLLYIHPSAAVGVGLLIGSIACLAVLYNGRHNWVFSWEIVLRLSLAAAPGVVLGAYIVAHLNKSILQIIIGSLIIIAALIQERFFPKPTKPLGVSPSLNPLGFISGMLVGVAAMGPPPLLMYLRSYKVTPEQIRQTLSLVFFLLNFVSLPSLILFKPGSLSGEGLPIFFWLLPVLLVAALVGRWASKQINAHIYNVVIYWMINVAGLSSIAFGIAGLR